MPSITATIALKSCRDPVSQEVRKEEVKSEEVREAGQGRVGGRSLDNKKPASGEIEKEREEKNPA